MKKYVFILVLTVVMLFALTSCGRNEAVHVEAIQEAEMSTFQINFGETFRAQINAVVDVVGVVGGSAGGWHDQNFYANNENDGWSLYLGWSPSGGFYGNPPENWESATQDERDQYFRDFLIGRNNLEYDHEINEFSVTFFHDGVHDSAYREITGKIVQIPGTYMSIGSAVIEFYSFHMQYDDEGAFFIDFYNNAQDEDRFNKNQAIFENFLGSIELLRFLP